MGKKQTHNYLDVSVPVSSRLPVWPGDPGIDIAFTKRPEEGNPVTASRLNLGSHSGTHIDAPAHFIPGGSTIDTIALDRLIGPCRVIDLTDAETIGVDELIAADWSADTGRLLLKTRNSSHWEDGTFYQGYCAGRRPLGGARCRRHRDRLPIYRPARQRTGNPRDFTAGGYDCTRGARFTVRPTGRL